MKTTAKVVPFTPAAAQPEDPCRNYGHPRREHTPACQDGGGCGNSCPCQRFVPYVPKSRA